jgi:hypothetical protein
MPYFRQCKCGPQFAPFTDRLIGQSSQRERAILAVIKPIDLGICPIGIRINVSAAGIQSQTELHVTATAER